MDEVLISWPDFWRWARVFGSTAESHHLPPGNHLDLDVGRWWRWRGNFFQRLWGQEMRVIPEIVRNGHTSEREFSFCLDIQKKTVRELTVFSFLIHVWMTGWPLWCCLTVAEVTALRTVLLHEGLPPLTEAKSSPRVTNSLLIYTACRHTDGHTSELETTVTNVTVTTGWPVSAVSSCETTRLSEPTADWP